MKIRTLAFSLLLLGAAACKTLSSGSGDTGPAQPTVLQVDNQGFMDMNVYAARSSQRIRLGTATGNGKTNFTIPSSLVSGLTPLRFVADPIGGRRASVSEEITVAPGDTVVLTIPPV
jgi:hypothetical protein